MTHSGWGQPAHLTENLLSHGCVPSTCLGKGTMPLPQAASWQDPGTELPMRQFRTFRLSRACDKAFRHVNPTEKNQCQLQTEEERVSTKTRGQWMNPEQRCPRQVMAVIYLVKAVRSFTSALIVKAAQAPVFAVTWLFCWFFFFFWWKMHVQTLLQ